MRLTLLTCFIILGQSAFGQTKISKELYTYVDSLITNVLKYQSDSIVTKDTIVTKNPRTGIVCYSSLPTNPEPLILIDQNIIEKEKLRDIKFEDIQIIEGLLKDNTTAMALYGQMGTNGIIFLTTKKFTQKSKKNQLNLGTTVFLSQ